MNTAGLSRFSGVTSTLAVSSLALAFACDGSGGGPIADMAMPPDLLMPDLKFAGYPAGPYGSDTGSTLQNFVFQGYYSPTSTTDLANTQPFGEVSFDAMRTSGKRYALIELAGFW